MSYVTVADLKSVLGVGDLYPDADLQQVLDASQNVVLSILSRYASSVDQVCCVETGTIKMRTTEPHLFYVGQTVHLEGFAPAQFNGDATVTEISQDTSALDPSRYWPSHFDAREPYNVLVVSKAHGQTPFTDVRPEIPHAHVYDKLQLDAYEDVPEVLEACLAIAVDMWQSRVAPGGTLEAADFTPGPYRLGRSLLSRVQALLARHMDVGSLAS